MLIGIDASRALTLRRTGTENYSLYLIRALLALDTPHHFRLYASSFPPPGLIPCAERCEWRVIPFPRLWTHVRLSVEMAYHPPDVLFVPAHVLPLVHPRHSVVTVHDLGHRHYPQAHTARQRWYLEWSTRYHVRVAAHIIADSHATRTDLIRLYRADPTRVTVVHLGVDERWRLVRDPARLAAVRRRYGIPDGPYLLYVGTLQPRKNLVRLIEAFARLVGYGKWHGLCLVCAGKKGWSYERIATRARKLGIARQVLFVGFVADADLPALYSGATLFVMPSLYEGFCLPVLEAMACGTPVACSDTSSLPEVVGDAALLFPPDDPLAMTAAIARALDDEPLRAELIERGYRRARSFTWENSARKVLAVLSDRDRSFNTT